MNFFEPENFLSFPKHHIEKSHHRRAYHLGHHPHTSDEFRGHNGIRTCLEHLLMRFDIDSFGHYPDIGIETSCGDGHKKVRLIARQREKDPLRFFDARLNQNTVFSGVAVDDKKVPA